MENVSRDMCGLAVHVCIFSEEHEWNEDRTKMHLICMYDADKCKTKQRLLDAVTLTLAAVECRTN